MKSKFNFKKKTLLLFILITLILFSINVYSNNLDEIIKSKSNLTLNVNINLSFEINPPNYDFKTKYVETILSLYPREDNNQKIISFNTSKEFKINDSKMLIIWDNPDFGEYNFIINSVINSNKFFTNFEKKIDFPINQLDQELEKYIKPSNFIDSQNVNIKKKSSEIVKGETDLFSAVYKLAKWVNNNIEYDINIIPQGSQKSSWVLENKYGVCDEMTNLFIAFCRSVGIPARFVSGLSYTNTGEFANTWGLHGWAEVYFPNIGWIPFDPTYGQYGYIDGSHIKLFYGEDQEFSSTRYRSTGVDLITRGLNYDVELINYDKKFKEPITIEAKAIKNEVAFGSYNLIEIKMINNNSYYIPLRLDISKTQGLELIGNRIEELLIYPNDKNKLFFTFKVEEDLSDNFIYTFPIIFKTKYGNLAKVNFTSQKFSPYYPIEEFELYKNIMSKTTDYLPFINLSCKQGKDFFYIEEDIYFKCFIKNEGNIPLYNLSICLDNCINFNLTISESLDLNLSLLDPQIGNYEKMIYIKGETYTSTKSNIKIFDQPKIKIDNINYPKEVEYNYKFPINISLKKESFSNPKNVTIILTDFINEMTWFFDEFDKDNNIILNVDSSAIRKNNNFKIIIEYYDLNNNKYYERNQFSIKVINLNLKQEILFVLKEISIFIERYIILSTIVVSIIMFLMIISILKTNRTRKEIEKEKKKIRKETFEELIKESEIQEKEDEKYFKKN